MHFENVCIESLGYTIPDEVVTSDELESRLAPVYHRLRLPPGRLELMTGIRERRFWEPGVLPSQMSIRSAEAAIAVADFDRDQIGLLIHGSVCRDHLEPATASRVHHELQLSFDCTIFDVSNACLGIMNGILQAASQIELGFIQSAIVVGSEGGRNLVETTIEHLNGDPNWTRQSIKSAVASLTIGSASCAVLLTHRDISRTHNRLLGGACGANTVHHRLCHSGQDQAVADGMRPLMSTDSERLLEEGVATGKKTYSRFLESMGDALDGNGLFSPDRSFCHQVGSAHRNQMLQSLELPTDQDYATFDWLGNTGAAALPTAMAMGLETQFAAPGHRLALLGIGSGINCVMLGVDWQKTLVMGRGEKQDSLVASSACPLAATGQA